MAISTRSATRQYSIAKARDHFPALVHAVEEGSPIELTRRGRPVAVLLSLDDYERLRTPRKSLWQASEQFRRETDLTQLHPEEVFAAVRDPSPGREVDL